MIQEHAQAVNDWTQAILRIDFAFGPAKMRREDHLCLVSESVLNGRQRLADASVVGDLRAVFAERHVEINADEYMLVLQIEVPNGKFRHRRSLIFLVGRCGALDDGIGLDLNAPGWIKKCGNHDHGGRWSNLTK